MTTARVEAFSDGVIAIIITIMVLELRAPHDASLTGLRPLLPVLGSYLLSYIFLGIYWSNHHHLLHAAQHVNGRVLWANLHLLFWLSLIPFVTAWMGENHFTTWPVALYGACCYSQPLPTQSSSACCLLHPATRCWQMHSGRTSKARSRWWVI